jgi:hypothetical protein
MKLYKLRFPCHLNFYVVGNDIDFNDLKPLEMFVYRIGINMKWRHGVECVYVFTDEGLARLLKIPKCRIIALEGSRIRKEMTCRDFVDVVKIINE